MSSRLSQLDQTSQCSQDKTAAKDAHISIPQLQQWQRLKSFAIVDARKVSRSATLWHKGEASARASLPLEAAWGRQVRADVAVLPSILEKTRKLIFGVTSQRQISKQAINILYTNASSASPCFKSCGLLVCCKRVARVSLRESSLHLPYVASGRARAQVHLAKQDQGNQHILARCAAPTSRRRKATFAAHERPQITQKARNLKSSTS